MQDWIVPVVAGVLALAALGLAVALLRARSRTERAIAAARAEAQAESAALRDQVAALERRLDRPRAAPEASVVITDLGREQSAEHAAERAEDEQAPTIGTALFADLVLRETVVKAASFAHGVRRAFEPETRNRIRFEMRREVKRARKQRKVDTREAVREWQQRQRADLPEEGSAA